MAKDRKKLLHIHSSVPDRQPIPATLEVGEIAVNNAENQEFLSVKNSNNKVVRFSSDEQLVTWMERKDVIPYSGTVENIHLDTNRSNIEIKLNQVAAENTLKHDVVNGAKDIDGDYVNPTEDGGVTNGAGFAIDMSLYAMQGANPTFSGITNTCYTELNGRTEILGGDGTEGSCRSLLNIDVLSATTNVSSAWTTVGTANTEITEANTVIGNDILHVSGTTTEIHDGDVIINNNSDKTENTIGVYTINNTNNYNINTSGDTNLTSNGDTNIHSDANICETADANAAFYGAEKTNIGLNCDDSASANTTNVYGNTLNVSASTANTTVNVSNTTATTTVYSGQTLNITEDETDITSCGHLRLKTNDFKIEQCEGEGGSAEFKFCDSYKVDSNEIILEECDPDGTILIKETTAEISGTTLTVNEGDDVIINVGDEFDVNVSGNTYIMTSGNTAIHSDGRLGLSSRGELILVSSEEDIIITANEDICETAGNKATFYGVNQTNIGLNCDDTLASTVTNLNGDQINVSGDTTDITSCGHLYLNTNDYKLQQCDGSQGSAEFKFCDGFKIESDAITLQECSQGNGSIVIKETNTEISGTTLVVNEGDDVTFNVGGDTTINTTGDTIITTTGVTQITSTQNVCVTSNADANFGGNVNTKIGADCQGNTGYSDNVYITASSSAFTYAPTIVNSGTTNNNTFVTENNNITTINTTAETINTTATTVNQSGDTYNVTANTEEHNTTSFTVNSSSAACIVSNDVASIGGDVTTNVGADCQGDAISNVTNIYGDTINQSGTTNNNTFVTINNSAITENNNITTINTSAATINTTATTVNTTANTINHSGDTYNVTANTEEHNTTSFTVNSSSAACIVSNDVASIGGDVTTNVGADCQGEAISNITNIYGDTINISGDTVNISGDSNIDGVLCVSSGLCKTLEWHYGDVRDAESGSTNFKNDESFTIPTSFDHLDEFNGSCYVLEHDICMEDNTIVAKGFFSRSDIRSKENINDLTNEDLENIDKIAFKSFNFKSDETKAKTYGVIAQDVKAAGLDSIVHEAEDKMLNVDYISLLLLKIAKMEKTIKELRNDVDILTDRLNFGK